MADQRADQEKGAVLIAVNSYWNNPEHHLLYSDRVLKEYIETFYRYLFFQVDVVVDFTLVDFIGKLNKFTTGCRKNGMNRIAVVLYGHGGIVGGKEYILTNDFNPLGIAALEEELHSQLPDDNKYLFIDACRNSVSVQPYVFQANTSRTTVIRSNLLFKMAISNAWSECFAMNLRKQGTLTIIVNNVDDNMKEKYTDDIRRKCDIPVNEGDQKSEISFKGASYDPSFRGEASAYNQERIRELTPYLQGLINVAEQSMTEMRARLGLPPEPILSFLDSPPDNRSNLTGPGLALSSAQDNRLALEKLQIAIEKHGAVTLHITRCILIGPPRVGKSCFKHLLVHNKPCLVKESTPVMDAPVVLASMWIQQGKEGTWKELTAIDLEKLLNKCAMDGKYNDGKTDGGNSTAEPLAKQPKYESDDSFAADQPTAASPWFQLTELKPQARLNDKPNPVGPSILSKKLSKFFHVVMSHDDIGVDLNHLKLMHIFDCGGQLAFQNTIPLLINAPCAFIAIFNAFEGLDKEIELTYCLGGEELPTGHKETQWNMLLSILSSIQSLQYKCHQDLKDLIKEQPEHSSPIAVVGTHKDKFGHSVTDDIKGIESRLSKLSGSNPCFFIRRKGQILNLVGNLTTDDLDQVAPLREAISENATFSLDLPIPWLILELFTRSRLTEQAFYPYSEFKELCRRHPLLMEEGDFNTCIGILHILGFYAFYPLRELSEDENWICTDAATLYKEVSKLLMVQHVNAGNNATARFKETGRISLKEKSLKKLFQDPSINIRADPKWLMHVLLHIGLAAKMKMERDSDSEAFIPLALPPGLSDIPSKTSVAPLCFTLDFTSDGCKRVSSNSTGIPRGTFSRLVVLLLSDQCPGIVKEWKIWDEDSKRSCIKFSLMDYSCAVYLKESMCHIEASVVLGETSLSLKGSDCSRTQAGSRLCQDIRETLTAALQKAFELVFDTSCQPKVVCGFACSKCDSSNGYNHLAIICEPSLSTDKRFPAKEYTAVCVFKKAKSVLTPDQLIWFKPGPFIPDSKFRYMDENKLWILEELSTAGPHSSPGDAPIEDVAFFLAYIDEMTSHLVILGVALELSSFTPPGDSPSDKCINTLKEWLKRTASPTVGKFCQCLEKAPSFNNLRETILPGVGEGSHSEQSPSTTQARYSARDPRGAEQLHRQECTQGPPAPRTGMDEKIGCSLDILGVPEYKDGLIGKMKSLGAVLGIEEDTKAILNRNGSVDDHLLGILNLYIEQKTPTWKDFCKALKRLACFNKVRAKIEADHDNHLNLGLPSLKQDLSDDTKCAV